MEDKVAVSKNTIFIILLIITILIVIGVLFSINNKKETKTEEDKIEIIEIIDESIIYGKYYNVQDSKSYIEITKEGYKYYMNTCEGYIQYSSDKYVFTKKITKSKGIYNVTINITSNDSKERLLLKFTSEFKETDTNIIINGPGSCSGSRQFIKS